MKVSPLYDQPIPAHAGGELQRVSEPQIHARSIPAHAGTPPIERVENKRVSDPTSHPPHGGPRCPDETHQKDRRSFHEHAGASWCKASFQSRMVSARACRRASAVVMNASTLGVSQRTRGKRGVDAGKPVRFWSIPAHTGGTETVIPTGCISRVYPRARGEGTTVDSDPFVKLSLSPPM